MTKQALRLNELLAGTGKWKPKAIPFLPEHGGSINDIPYSRYEMELRNLILHLLKEQGEANMTEILNYARTYSHRGTFTQNWHVNSVLWKMVATEALMGDRRFIYFYRNKKKKSYIPSSKEIRFSIRNRSEFKNSFPALRNL